MHFHCHSSVTRFTVWDNARTSPHPLHPDPVCHALHLFSRRCFGPQPSKAPSPGADDYLAGAYYYPWYADPAQSEERGWMRQALQGNSRQLLRLSLQQPRPGAMELTRTKSAEKPGWIFGPSAGEAGQARGPCSSGSHSQTPTG